MELLLKRNEHEPVNGILRERSHITSSAEGGGGFQKMTLDDGGRGGYGAPKRYSHHSCK